MRVADRSRDFSCVSDRSESDSNDLIKDTFVWGNIKWKQTVMMTFNALQERINTQYKCASFINFMYIMKVI